MSDEASGDKCQRCGEVGEDRRTLWMACFYAMDELKVPFEKKVVFDTDHSKLVKARDAQGIKLHDGTTLNIMPGALRTEAELTPREMFTLRVCKDCRSSWMSAIADWFKEVPAPSRYIGSGIFVRRNGTNVEITEEEWFRLNPGREPVRAR